MTVAQLIALLEECDPDAEVRIMSQEDWPFENGILGVNVRENFAGDCDEDDCEVDDELLPNDVFIVEGEQERYGSKAAWRNVLR